MGSIRQLRYLEVNWNGAVGHLPNYEQIVVADEDVYQQQL